MVCLNKKRGQGVFMSAAIIEAMQDLVLAETWEVVLARRGRGVRRQRGRLLLDD